MSPAHMYRWEECANTPLSLFSELSSDELNLLQNEAEKLVNEEYEYSDISISGYCFQKGQNKVYNIEGSVQYYNLCTTIE